jgi:hypothetical protein
MIRGLSIPLSRPTRRPRKRFKGKELNSPSDIAKVRFVGAGASSGAGRVGTREPVADHPRRTVAGMARWFA